MTVLDPIGVWWGLRSAADGSEGLPLVIFGGDHADLPLTEPTGARLADVDGDTIRASDTLFLADRAHR